MDFSKHQKCSKKNLNCNDKQETDESEIDQSSILLEDAIKNGDLNLVKDIVASGYDINGEVTGFPLALASARGHFDIVKFLLDSGAFVDKVAIRTTIIQTPLYLAAMGGHKDIAQLLIDKGANVNFYMSNGKHKNISSVLETATRKRHPEIVRSLIYAGASVNKKFGYGCRTPIHIAVKNGDLEIVQDLINANAKINVEDGIGSTPINNAMEDGNLDLIRILLKAGANPNIPDGFCHFPIRNAVRNGITSENTKNIVELLLNKNTNPLPVMKSFEDETGDYIIYRIISKRMITKEKAEEGYNNLSKEDKPKVARFIKLLNAIDARIFKGIKENLMTEEKARELGFIERYNEVLEKRNLLEQGLENMRIKALIDEKKRVKNTNERERNFGIEGIFELIETFLG
jgi:ankyrin repeat protein